MIGLAVVALMTADIATVFFPAVVGICSARAA
jgi:hypothetical protein